MALVVFFESRQISICQKLFDNQPKINMSKKTIKNDQFTKQKDEKKILIKKKIEDDVLTR